MYRRFVDAALGDRSQDEYYRAAEGRLLGSEDFLEKIKHRVGEHRVTGKPIERTNIEDVLTVAAKTCGVSLEELCSKSKNRRTVAVKEAVIVVGRERGISNQELAEALGIGASAVTRRVEAVRSREGKHPAAEKLRKALTLKR